MTKLVEVTLPVEAISIACRRDKDKKTGTIRNVHKWFAPMPLPAWRALLFATLVDDPGDADGRAYLTDVIKRLVPDNGGPPDARTLAEARKLIQEATGGSPPTVYDPFCGGGSTLVEAQRLGLPAAGSDLNPVPVLITRVLTELMPQVAGRPPLIADPARLKISGHPLDGFLADCRHYAQRIRDEVWQLVGHLYPPEPGGGNIIAWLWTRTVTCPNPACRATAPLASSFWLSKRKGAAQWVEPIGGRPGGGVRLEVRSGTGGPPPAPKAGRGGTFRCVVCGETIPEPYVKAEGMADRMGTQLLAVAVDRPNGRAYLDGVSANEPPVVDRPVDAPDLEFPDNMRDYWCKIYGLRSQADLYTSRQLVMLGAFADSVAQLGEQVRADGGDELYAKAIASVLGLCASKLAMSHSTQARWYIGGDSGSTRVQAAFGRQALPMVWDFVELNPFGDRAANWAGIVDSVAGGLRSLPSRATRATTFQADARVALRIRRDLTLIATDPPYFAQIGYADLSDYFYVWLRRSLAAIHPDLFTTIATPKSDELIAAPYRHGGNSLKAKSYFVDGFTDTFQNLSAIADTGLPMLVVYAHRQEDANDGGVSSTAWDAMLSAIIAAGLRIVGTWPIHATGSTRQMGQGTNALASYVVMVCRPQVAAARPTDHQGFLGALRAELPKVIKKLQEASISTIDLGQATIGPGMAIFSRFSRIIEPSGQSMSVHSALELISQVQSEVLDEFVGDLDPETRWAMLWYRDHGFGPGPFDDAEKISMTVVTSVESLERAGVAHARAGKVILIGRDWMPENWSPATGHVTVWQVTQQLVKRLTTGGGEQAAADLLRECRRWADDARNLAYWLSQATVNRRPAEALDYEALVTSWTELARLAERPAAEAAPVAEQVSMLGEEPAL